MSQLKELTTEMFNPSKFLVPLDHTTIDEIERLAVKKEVVNKIRWLVDRSFTSESEKEITTEMLIRACEEISGGFRWNDIVNYVTILFAIYQRRGEEEFKKTIETLKLFDNSLTKWEMKYLMDGIDQLIWDEIHHITTFREVPLPTIIKVLSRFARHYLSCEWVVRKVESCPYEKVNEVLEVLDDEDIANLISNIHYNLVDGIFELIKRTRKKDATLRLAKEIEDLYSRDETTTWLLLDSLYVIHQLFGENYFESVVNYFIRRRDREGLRKIQKITRIEKVSREIQKIEVEGKLGNKKAKRLIDLAYYLNVASEFGLETNVSENLRKSYERVRNDLANYLLEEYGIRDWEKALRFIPWLKARDETAIRVLKGERIEKYGVPKSYDLGRSDNETPLEDIKKELMEYARMVGVEIEDVNDLYGLKDAARRIMSEVNKRKDIEPEIKKEIIPNLNRILNLTHARSSGYKLVIDPSNLELQMYALQIATSCLSPGGVNFHYTQEYMKNPYVFWAVIEDANGNVVGRVTIFVGHGTNPEKTPYIARVSKVYSIVPINEEIVDDALRQYAKDCGYKFLERGTMIVPGLTKIYDDYARSGKELGEVVVIKY